MKQSGQLLNIHLKSLGDQIKTIAGRIESISFSNVYRGKNQDVDRLSKDGHQLMVGKVLFDAIKEAVVPISEDTYA